MVSLFPDTESPRLVRGDPEAGASVQDRQGTTRLAADLQPQDLEALAAAQGKFTGTNVLLGQAAQRCSPAFWPAEAASALWSGQGPQVTSTSQRSLSFDPPSGRITRRCRWLRIFGRFPGYFDAIAVAPNSPLQERLKAEIDVWTVCGYSSNKLGSKEQV